MKKTASTIGLIFTLSFSMSTFMVSPTNAAEDTWTTMAPLLPHSTEGRYATAAVNGKIYVVGVENFFEYDPTANTWQTKASRLNHSSSYSYVAVAYQNKIYVIGGWNNRYTEIYDPVSDTVEFSSNNSRVSRITGVEANVVDDKIYVIGGGTNYSLNSGIGGISDQNFVYDALNDSWSKMAPIPTAVMDYASSVVDGNIYIIGGRKYGRINASHPNIVTDLVQIFDPKTNQWSQGTPIPTSVWYAGACATTGLMAPKRIYVVGGWVQTNLTSDGSQGTNLTQVYDIENDGWSVGVPMPSTLRPSLTLTNINDTLYAIDGLTNEKYIPIGYIPEFPSWIILPIFATATLVALIIKKRMIYLRS